MEESDVIIQDVSDQETDVQGYFFDTAVGLKIYGEDAHELAEGCMCICTEMENVFSAQRESSELYKVNHRTEETVEVSEDLAACLDKALDFCRRTDGAYDITVLPLTDLWDFSDHKDTVPSEKEIKEALERVDYTKVHLEGTTLVFDSADTTIDLGSAAKGYISMKLKDYLRNNGCESALIDLGHNISTVGSKTDGSHWKIGLQTPFEDSGTILDTVEVSGKCVISSGIYERYFEEDGKIYHHILDPQTGFPAETDLNMATIVGEDDTVCDILSTVCMLLGKDKAEKFAGDIPDVRVCLTDTDNQYQWID